MYNEIKPEKNEMCNEIRDPSFIKSRGGIYGGHFKNICLLGGQR